MARRVIRQKALSVSHLSAADSHEEVIQVAQGHLVLVKRRAGESRNECDRGRFSLVVLSLLTRRT